jgi:hypothetical protein
VGPTALARELAVNDALIEVDVGLANRLLSSTISQLHIAQRAAPTRHAEKGVPPQPIPTKKNLKAPKPCR